MKRLACSHACDFDSEGLGAARSYLTGGSNSPHDVSRIDVFRHSGEQPTFLLLVHEVARWLRPYSRRWVQCREDQAEEPLADAAWLHHAVNVSVSESGRGDVLQRHCHFVHEIQAALFNRAARGDLGEFECHRQVLFVDDVVLEDRAPADTDDLATLAGGDDVPVAISGLFSDLVGQGFESLRRRAAAHWLAADIGPAEAGLGQGAAATEQGAFLSSRVAQGHEHDGDQEGESGGHEAFLSVHGVSI